MRESALAAIAFGSATRSGTLQRVEFDTALKLLWSCIVRLNQDIDRKEPWRALKEGETAELHRNLTQWLKGIHEVACWLQPFLPGASAQILKTISKGPVKRCAPLFPRA